MQFDKEFMEALEQSILGLSKKETFYHEESISILEKLLAIKTYIRNIEMLDLQTKVLKQSETAFQNIDFDKLDFKSMIQQVMGK